ncbi:MAG: hypothetical protein ACXADC_16080 [Candidatus Thorarchaeota archaeon]|jgi:N-carbamoylputrescine amidase
MRKVRIGLVQAQWEGDVKDEGKIEENIEKMIRKHEGFADIAMQQEVQILCFQELFYGPYFCAEQDRKWYKSRFYVSRSCSMDPTSVLSKTESGTNMLS